MRSWIRKHFRSKKPASVFQEPDQRQIELGLLRMTLRDIGIREDKEFEMRKNAGLVGCFYRVQKDGESDA